MPIDSERHHRPHAGQQNQNPTGDPEHRSTIVRHLHKSTLPAKPHYPRPKAIEKSRIRPTYAGANMGHPDGVASSGLNRSPRSGVTSITLQTYATPITAPFGCPMFAPAYVGRIRLFSIAFTRGHWGLSTRNR